MRRTSSTTVVTALPDRTAALQRLARRGAAASAEGHAGCLLLDPKVVIRLRAIERVSRREFDELEATRRLADAQQAYAAQRDAVIVAA